MVDSFLLYASGTLAVLGAVAFLLSLFFWSRLRRLNGLSENSAVNVYNRTFVVFDPYEPKTVLHRLAHLLPLMSILGSAAGAFVVLAIASSGLVLTVLVLIVALSLIVIEESPEAYSQCRLFIRAIQHGSDFGEGDLKLLNVTKKILPKLSMYYLGISVLLFTLAGTLPSVWFSAVTYFALPIGFIIQASAAAGMASWLFAAGFYAVLLAVVIVFVRKARNRVFAID